MAMEAFMNMSFHRPSSDMLPIVLEVIERAPRPQSPLNVEIFDREDIIRGPTTATSLAAAPEGDDEEADDEAATAAAAPVGDGTEDDEVGDEETDDEAATTAAAATATHSANPEPPGGTADPEACLLYPSPTPPN